MSFSKDSLLTNAYKTEADDKQTKQIMKNMNAQMHRYGSILEQQRKRVQSSAMLVDPKSAAKRPSKATFVLAPEAPYGRGSSIDAVDISVGVEDKRRSHSKLLPNITDQSVGFKGRKQSYSTLRPMSLARYSVESLKSRKTIDNEESMIRS